jgi:hypothetical protein
VATQLSLISRSFPLLGFKFFRVDIDWLRVEYPDLAFPKLNILHTYLRLRLNLVHHGSCTSVEPDFMHMHHG